MTKVSAFCVGDAKWSIDIPDFPEKNDFSTLICGYFTLKKRDFLEKSGINVGFWQKKFDSLHTV